MTRSRSRSMLVASARRSTLMYVLLLLAIWLLWGLSACSGWQTELAQLAEEIQDSSAEIAQPAGLEFTPDSVAEAVEHVAGQVSAPVVAVQEIDEPARFTFPTPMPAPVSAWRPPLYPVPWAVNPYDHFFFTRPIPVDEVNWPLANYRYGGIFFEDVVHTGVDIPGPIGTQILAAGPGKVVWVGYGLLNFNPDNKNDPYGLAVSIKHDFGFNGEPLYTLYAHMSEIFVVRDQVVETGDLIGLMGRTGVTTGPHLHFEVRVGRNDYFATYNPELWMAPPQGWGVLAGQVMDKRGQPLHRQTIDVFALDNNRTWQVISYGPSSVNRDPYYQENVVLGDLPAGRYRLALTYEAKRYIQDITIAPGVVNFFVFRGEEGFLLQMPPTPTVEYPELTP
jgi:murein DD-endopeptidase MepM/ murein hydrolase activator NlpD